MPSRDTASLRLESPGAADVTAWRDLSVSSGASPFAHPGWVNAWAAAFGHRLTLLSTHRDDGPCGFLPIVRAGRTAATPTDWHTPVFEAVTADDAALADLAESLMGLGADRLVLGFVDRDSPTLEVMSSVLRAGGFHLEVRHRMSSPFIDLSIGWEAFASGLSSKKLGDLRRRRRRLDEQGEVTITVHDGAHQLDRMLTEVFETEAAGWKGERSTAIASNPATERLYRAAARWAAAEGWLRLSFLRLDGRAVAVDYSIEVAGRHYLLKTGYDPQFRAFAPGRLLRLEMIRRAFADGVDTYEFAGSDDPWKREWTGTTRQIVDVTAYAPTAAGRMLYLSARPLRAFRRTLRHPA